MNQTNLIGKGFKNDLYVFSMGINTNFICGGLKMFTLYTTRNLENKVAEYLKDFKKDYHWKVVSHAWHLSVPHDGEYDETHISIVVNLQDATDKEKRVWRDKIWI